MTIGKAKGEEEGRRKEVKGKGTLNITAGDVKPRRNNKQAQDGDED